MSRWIKQPEKVKKHIRSLPCHYCGKPGGTIDHVVPVKLGGTDDLENLVPACKSCNNSKYSHSLRDWEDKKAIPFI